VDFLNLELGIMHQDITPRNLLVDPATYKLVLFDFNFAARGKYNLMDGRDDASSVVFSLYELITNDTHFTSIPPRDRNIDMVQSISEWPCNRELGSDVLVFRSFLNEWVVKRRSDRDMERYLNAPNPAYMAGPTKPARV
jgi:serine/threonine protein kinase